MQVDIDPSSITHENLPVVVSAMLVMLDENCRDTKDIKTALTTVCTKVDDHDKVINVAKVSLCTIVPWVKRNKYVIGTLVAGVSVWFSMLDWINRWLQWSFLPPTGGP